MTDAYVLGALVLALFVVMLLASRKRSTLDSQPARDDGPDPHPKKPAARRGRVHKILDGDTVIAMLERRKVTIRLEGIDCPENGQHWGNIAKAGLIKLIGGKEILVEESCLDQYGRTLATIYVRREDQRDWMNVNARMVVLGHAWVSRITCKNLPKVRRDELFRMQQWAKNKRVGLWRVDDPTPPWEFRRSND